MTAPTGVIQKRERTVRELFERGASTREIADAVGVTPRSVRRILLRLELVELCVNLLSDETLERIRIYAEEGMPANWIADDLGIHYDTARTYACRVPGHDEAVVEWLRAWHSIRQREALLELHYEIAPTWLSLRTRALDAA